MLQCKTKWKKKKLGNLGYTYSGLSNKTIDDFGSGEDFIPYMNIYKNSIIKIDKFEQVKIGLNEHQNQVQSGDVFFTTSSETPEEVGLTSVLIDRIDKPLYLNSFCFGFRLNDNNEFNNTFLAYLLRGESVRLQISKMAQGSTRYNLSKTQLLNKLNLYYPNDKNEQEKISRVLLTCDEVIEKTEETIEKYKQIKAGLMQDLFTRGLDGNGKLRPTYTQAPDLYKYSEELDRYIPKEWDTDKLDSEKVAVINPPCGKLPNEFIYIDLESVINGNLEQTKIISRVGAPSRAQRLIENYDILYQTVRPYQKNNYLYVQTTNMKSVASTGYAQIRTVLEPLFLYQYLHTDLFVNKVLCLCTGTSYPAINPTNLGKLYIPIPKTEEQKHIANLFKIFDMKINKENEVLSKYKQIKQGLMKRLLTPPADAEIVEE